MYGCLHMHLKLKSREWRLPTPQTSIILLLSTILIFTTSEMSLFATVATAPPDPLFSLMAKYKKDTFAKKVDLGVGAYRDNTGNPWILNSVKEAEEQLSKDPNNNHEYLPIAGLSNLIDSAAAKLVFGKNLPENRVTVQSLSGTGALHLAAGFLSKFLPLNSKNEKPKVYVSDPTWANHWQIFENVGFKVDSYPYWDAVNLALNFDGYTKKLNSIDDGSIIVLHTCAHNPTGIDLTHQQWEILYKIFIKKNLFPIFDTAYQGFATGSLENDAWPIHYFLNQSKKDNKNIELIVCQSFAKNFGLYGERAGTIHLIVNSNSINAVKSQMAILQRSEISNPPSYGAKIVSKILNDENLYNLWLNDLKIMSSRIKSNRENLRNYLEKLNTPGKWDHITRQVGMFSFTGLSPDLVDKLINKYHIYLSKNGRISMAGLNDGNIEYVAKSIDSVIREKLETRQSHL